MSPKHAEGPDEVLNSPRLLNLPLLLLANKQDAPSSLSVAEVRESFDAWTRSKSFPQDDDEPRVSGGGDRKGKGKGKALPGEGDSQEDGEESVGQKMEAGRSKGFRQGDDGGAARDERVASLDVMGVSALEG